MFGLFRKKEIPRSGEAEDRRVFDVAAHLERREAIPLFSQAAWQYALAEFADDVSDTVLAERLTAAGRSWLHTLNAEAFEGRMRYGESKHFMLQGGVSPERGKLILAFAEKALLRYEHDLEGVMEFGPASKMPILAFAEQDDYYRYVSAYFPDGHFGLSSGMYLSRGIGHFVFPEEELWMLEPVIAHELLHAVVKHLPLPAWLNEGLASNAEFRYGNRFHDPRTTNDSIAHHRRYWNAEKLQRFWAGYSFFNADDGQELSYDLARRLVSGLSPNWNDAREFVLQAHLNDAGESKANEILGYSLAIAAEAITSVAGAVPDPSKWTNHPFGGGYA